MPITLTHGVSDFQNYWFRRVMRICDFRESCERMTYVKPVEAWETNETFATHVIFDAGRRPRRATDPEGRPMNSVPVEHSQSCAENPLFSQHIRAPLWYAQIPHIEYTGPYNGFQPVHLVLPPQVHKAYRLYLGRDIPPPVLYKPTQQDPTVLKLGGMALDEGDLIVHIKHPQQEQLEIYSFSEQLEHCPYLRTTKTGQVLCMPGPLDEEHDSLQQIALETPHGADVAAHIKDAEYMHKLERRFHMPKHFNKDGTTVERHVCHVLGKRFSFNTLNLPNTQNILDLQANPDTLLLRSIEAYNEQQGMMFYVDFDLARGPRRRLDNADISLAQADPEKLNYVLADPDTAYPFALPIEKVVRKPHAGHADLYTRSNAGENTVYLCKNPVLRGVRVANTIDVPAAPASLQQDTKQYMQAMGLWTPDMKIPHEQRTGAHVLNQGDLVVRTDEGYSLYSFEEQLHTAHFVRVDAQNHMLVQPGTLAEESHELGISLRADQHQPESQQNAVLHAHAQDAALMVDLMRAYETPSHHQLDKLTRR